MLSKSYVLAVLAAVILGCTLPSSAATARSQVAVQGHFYYLVQVRVADASPPAYLWEVRQEAVAGGSDDNPPLEVFASLASPDLRQWVSHLPAHSAISYTIGLEQDFIRGDVDKVMDAAKAQTGDLGQFCQSKGVRFNLCAIAA